MEILTGRILLQSGDPAGSQEFYRDILGLAVFREFGPPDAPSMVFFMGNSLLEVSGQPTQRATGPAPMQLWFQVREVVTEYDRLNQTGVTVVRAPRTEPWGLIEAWITDPDGIDIVLVQIPADHPLRRDQRPIESLQ